MEERSKPSQLDQLSDLRARRLSRLELLPVELIQKIFLDSLEVNLARASPALARYLSSESIYRILLLYSFFDENKESKINDKPLGSSITKAFRPAEYRSLDLKERTTLQTAVLNCRWCTYGRVKACLPELLRLSVKSVWTENGVRMEDEERLRLESFNYEELDKGTATSESIKGFMGVDERDGRMLMLKIYSTFKVDVDEADEQSEELLSRLPPIPTRFRTFRPVTCFGFPSKILCEPWTFEKIRFFHLLRKHRETTLFADSRVWPLESASDIRQSVQRAIDNAIRESDLDLLHALLIMDRIFWDSVHFRQLREKIQNPPNQYAISEDHFKVALEQGENVARTLRMLIRFDNRSLPWWNLGLMVWAESQSNSFGKTLLRLMHKLETGEGHIGRDVAMLMLDENASNGQSIVAARAEMVQRNLESLSLAES